MNTRRFSLEPTEREYTILVVYDSEAKADQLIDVLMDSKVMLKHILRGSSSVEFITLHRNEFKFTHGFTVLPRYSEVRFFDFYIFVSDSDFAPWPTGWSQIPTGYSLAAQPYNDEGQWTMGFFGDTQRGTTALHMATALYPLSHQLFGTST